MSETSELQKKLAEALSENENLKGENDLLVAEIGRYRSEVLGLNQKIEGLIQKVSMELQLAQRLQRRLSPVEIPHLSGFEFSSKFNFGTRSGGDYFDVFELPEKMKFAVIIASCSGYSVSALLLSTLLKTAATDLKSSSASTAESNFSRLQNEMLNEMTDHDSCSLVYAVIDRRNFEMEVYGCGQINVFIQRYGKDAIESIEIFPQPFSTAFQAKRAAQESGAKQSGERSSEPISQVLSLQPKDRVLFTSSGVLHALNKENQEFGLERLLKAVQSAPRKGVHDLRNEVMFRLEQFTQQNPPLADQTVVAIEVKDRVIKLAKP